MEAPSHLSPRQGLFDEIRRLRGDTLTKDSSEHPIKTGDLKKTTQSRKNNSTVGPARERRFQLTEVAVEYLERFSQVKVRRSFPLTSIESVEEDKENPRIFKLVFSATVMLLEAPSSEEATDWVQKIREVWAKWHVIPTPTDSLLGTSTEEGLPEGNTAAKCSCEIASDSAGEGPMDDGPGHSAGEGPMDDSPGHSAGEGPMDDSPGHVVAHDHNPKQYKYPWRRGLIKRRVHHQQPPRLVRMMSNSHFESKAFEKLHEEYAMIKYPHKKWSIPSEKLVHIDKDNLQILWRRSGLSAFHMSNILPLHHVLEIREGQLTKWFHHFPYEEVDGQSLSLVYEEERNGYVSLTSLDLICDNPAHYKDWIEGLGALISGSRKSMWSSIYPTTDPFILWLKSLWSTKHSDHELPEKAALSLLLKIHPSCDVRLAKEIIMTAHNHQCSSTTNYGNAILWDGLTLLFNLMCDNGNLLKLFRSYTKEYPTLGMTKEEFGDFLIEECMWRRGDCTKSAVLKVMKHHDYHHKSFKKYVAKNNPLAFTIATTKPLLTYAGFLSFLRSRDNAAYEEEEQCQNMDQPLSHYFINSSHNTYLEGDQLKGTSSCEAYVRALLQGCRCLEIDCWDGALRVGGDSIIVYHGHTLTTKLDFTAVVNTIRDYAFHASLYPVIISIENHCSPSNQRCMAEHFVEIMGDVLCKDNLVEIEGRERLPSPTELQGKIILKGTSKRKEGKAPIATASSELNLAAVNTNGVEEPTCVVSDDNQHMLSIYGLDAPKMAEQDDQETTFVDDTAKALEDLIVYCRSISIKPWSWKEQRKTTVSEMFSFGEPSAMKLCRKEPHKMLACTERQLVRTYPRGTRFDSSNYDPTLMWGCGVQMAALNFQTPDVWMHLNQGFFRQNGGCGYVLKPEVMRRSSHSSVEYSPLMTEPHPNIPTVDLEIELISGQLLCPYKKKCVGLTVDIRTYGIPADTCVSDTPLASHNSAFWPQWERGTCVYRKRKILMPELCLVYFRVEVQYKIGKPQLFGQNCIPLFSLRPGIKFIPLRTSGGELIQESGLFVKITKETDRSGEHVLTSIHTSISTPSLKQKHTRPRLTHQNSFEEIPECM